MKTILRTYMKSEVLHEHILMANTYQERFLTSRFSMVTIKQTSTEYDNL